MRTIDSSVLPIATAAALGIIKAGSGLAVDASGNLTSSKPSRVVTTTPITVSASDNNGVVMSDLTVAGAVAFTLPSNPGNGFSVTIGDAKGDADTNGLTLNASGADTFMGGGTSMTISIPNGMVTLVYLNLVWYPIGKSSTAGASRFRAHQSTAQSGLISGSQKVTFTTVDFDKLGEYSTTNSRFTAKVAGNYMVATGVSMNTIASAGAQLALDVYVNGSFHTRLYYEWTSTSNTSPEVQGSALIELNAGDYMEIFLYTGTAGLATQSGTTITYFAATKIA